MLRSSPATALSLLLARSQTAVSGDATLVDTLPALQRFVTGAASGHLVSQGEAIGHVWPCFPAAHSAQQAGARGYAAKTRPAPKRDTYASAPTNYVQLLQHIHRANQLYKLRDLVSEHSGKLDAVHVSAALARLPKLAWQRHEPSAELSDAKKQKVELLLGQLSQQMLEMRGRMFMRQVANAVWSCGKLAEASPAASKSAWQLAREMLRELKDPARGLLRSSAPVELAQVLVGMAHLDIKDSRLMQRLALRTETLLPQMSGPLMAQVAWALAEMRHKDEALMSGIGQRAIELKWHFRPREAAMVAWAFAKLSQPHPGLLPALSEVVLEHLPLTRPNAISSLAYACAKLGHNDAALLDALCQQAVQQLEGFTDHGLGILLRALRALGHKHEPLLQAVARGIASERAVQVKVQEAGSFLEVFAHFGQQGPDVDFMAANLFQSVAKKLHKLRPGVVVRFLESMLAAGRRDEQLLNITCDFVAEQVDHYAKRMQFRSLQPRALAPEECNPFDFDARQQLQLLRALNALQFKHQPLLEALSASVVPTAWAAPPSVLAYLLLELTRAGVRSTTLAAQVGENCINPALDELTPTQMCAALAGCTAMGNDNGPLARAVRDWVKKDPTELTPFGAAVLPAAMVAEPKWFDQQAFDAMYGRALDLLAEGKMGREAVLGLVAAMGKAGHKHSGLLARVHEVAVDEGWEDVAAAAAELS